MKRLTAKPVDTLKAITSIDPYPCFQWEEIAEKYPDPQTAYKKLNATQVCTVVFTYLKLSPECLCGGAAIRLTANQIRKRFPWGKVARALRKKGIMVKLPTKRKKVAA